MPLRGFTRDLLRRWLDFLVRPKILSCHSDGGARFEGTFLVRGATLIETPDLLRPSDDKRCPRSTGGLFERQPGALYRLAAWQPPPCGGQPGRADNRQTQTSRPNRVRIDLASDLSDPSPSDSNRLPHGAPGGVLIIQSLQPPSASYQHADGRTLKMSRDTVNPRPSDAIARRNR